jgi:cytoskeleton protein RodZ
MGYIRAYAGLLETDPAPLIDAFREQQGTGVAPVHTPTQAEENVSGNAPLSSERSQARAQWQTVGAACVVLGIVILLWWYLTSGDQSPSPIDSSADPQETLAAAPSDTPVYPSDAELFKDASPAPAADAVQTGDQPATPRVQTDTAKLQAQTQMQAGSEAEADTVASSERVVQGSSAAQKPLDAQAAAVVPVLTADNTQDAAGDNALTNTPRRPIAVVDESTSVKTITSSRVAERAQPALDTQATLLLKAETDSWVSVIDADAKRLMYGVLTNATPRKLQGTPPFDVVLGAASGIELTLNGRAVDFSSMIRKSKTARFLLLSDGDIERQSQEN